jgi:hypothetical protein
MAIVVELVFHLLPLALVMTVLTKIAGEAAPARASLVAVIAVALLEPTYQAALSVGSRAPPPWPAAFVWVHVYALNLAQLLLFRRHDFVAMVVLRLAYYAIWHVAWGHARLVVLFAT